ncbi:regulatory protein RecX [Lentisphaerota bacterium WC36G]|nr:regulatory protein RecX [Lentisphaerae bacterium WC36]
MQNNGCKNVVDGKTINLEKKVEKSNIFSDNDYQKVWSKALNILNRRDHSVNELKGKLFDREMPAKQIFEVIEELQRLNFLDDERFAEMYKEDLLRRGYGEMRIKNYLYKKRLATSLIDKTCSEIDFNDQVETAIQLIKNKLKGTYRREKDFFKLQQKLTRHLVGRGFSFDVINDAFDETIKKK